MNKKPYSQRNNTRNLTLKELYDFFVYMYNFFLDKDFFTLMGIYYYKDESVLEYVVDDTYQELLFNPFPINNWDSKKLTEPHLFDIIEYLYDKVRMPPEEHFSMHLLISGEYMSLLPIEKRKKIASERKKEYREYINKSLSNYKDGYELTEEGQILSLGSHGIQYILNADIPILGNDNIDLKIKNAIIKFRNRGNNIDDRKQAIMELVAAFEYMRDTKMLKDVLNKKDESDLFNIANNFGIRHHKPDQQQNYDKNIWYSWIFHFYLATFHAVARMIKKQQDSKSQHK